MRQHILEYFIIFNPIFKLEGHFSYEEIGLKNHNQSVCLILKNYYCDIRLQMV